MTRMIVAFVISNMNLAFLIDGQCSLIPYRFEFSVFGRVEQKT